MSMKVWLMQVTTISILTGNANDNGLAVRPVASINWGYIVINYVRDNVETNCCPFVFLTR